jgi:hypothetical protein
MNSWDKKKNMQWNTVLFAFTIAHILKVNKQ